MTANMNETEHQYFEQYEIVEKPKKDSRSKYDEIYKAVGNLDSEKALKFSLTKYSLSLNDAKKLLAYLRASAKKKYSYRMGGTVQNNDLYLWKNSN